MAPAAMKQSQKQQRLWDLRCSWAVWTEWLGEPERSSREGARERSLVPGEGPWHWHPAGSWKVAVSPLCMAYLC